MFTGEVVAGFDIPDQKALVVGLSMVLLDRGSTIAHPTLKVEELIVIEYGSRSLWELSQL